MLTPLLALALVLSGSQKSEPAADRGPPMAATEAELSTIRSALDNKLLDAESARLKDFQVRHGKPGDADFMSDACGLVNAKNKFGAYTGYQKWYVIIFRGRDGAMHGSVLGDPDFLAPDMCARLGM